MQGQKPFFHVIGFWLEDRRRSSAMFGRRAALRGGIQVRVAGTAARYEALLEDTYVQIQNILSASNCAAFSHRLSALARVVKIRRTSPSDSLECLALRLQDRVASVGFSPLVGGEAIRGSLIDIEIAGIACAGIWCPTMWSDRAFVDAAGCQCGIVESRDACSIRSLETDCAALGEGRRFPVGGLQNKEFWSGYPQIEPLSPRSFRCL
jgi:hypothetical protein